MYELIRTLIVPPALPLLIVLGGLLLLTRRPRLGRRMVMGGLGLLYLLSTGLVSATLIDFVEVAPTIRGPDWQGAGAIVVLSAGVERNAFEYGGETVDAASLVRLRYAAKLHRETGLPLLVTGGRTPWTTGAIATAMKKTLESDFGVPVKWVEDRAETTAGNASLSAAILAPAGISKILLVTEAYHMRRSVSAFEAVAMTVVPAPTISHAVIPWQLEIIYPSTAALLDSTLAIHEMIGIVWYKLRGFA